MEEKRQHTVRLYDGELSQLHFLVLQMGGLVMTQLENTIASLKDRESKPAEAVILLDKKVDEYEVQIDTEVFNIITKRCPVANDLRMVISISKIVVDLERIGDEVVKIARILIGLFVSDNSDPNPQLLRDLVKMNQLVLELVRKTLHAFDSGDSKNAYFLLQETQEFSSDYLCGVRLHMTFVMENAHMLSRTLNIFQIMKAFERCSDHCQNIAEYLIFMIDGKNVRHRHVDEH